VNHPRARLSALVDGELDHDDRDRVLAHLTQCDECRAIVEAERRVKALLGGMSEPAPSEDFLAALSGMAASADTGARGERSADARRDGAMANDRSSAANDHTPAAEPGASQETGQALPRQRLGAGVSAASDTLEAPVALGFGSLPPNLGGSDPESASAEQWSVRRRPRPTPRPRSRPDRGRRPRALAGRRLPLGLAGAASLAGMALLTACAIGGQPTVPAEQPARVPVERFTIEHAVNVSELPLTDRGATAALLDDAERSGWGQADR